jgi:hypothetical protein
MNATRAARGRTGLGGDGFAVICMVATDQTHPHPGLPLEGEGEKQSGTATQNRC